MKILAVDYGTKRVGLALSDETETFAHRLDPIENYKDDQDLVNKLANIVNNEGVELLLFGLPLGVENKPTEMSKKITEFIQQLKTIVKSDVKTVNETYTSVAAHSNLGRYSAKISIDSESARILLQEYLDDTKLRIQKSQTSC